MPRKKSTITETLNLTGHVRVTIEAPADKWPHITRDGSFLSIEAEQGRLRVGGGVAQHHVGPTTNGPDHDTPEILALKAKMGLAKEVKPVTTNDVFADAGLGDVGDLETAVLNGGLQ